ncbi:MAG: hypothetical protein REH79_02340 [Spiroplasma sp.]|nr:hypothetical protein [Spiroplasma sp.]
MNNIEYVIKADTKKYKEEFNKLFQKIKNYFIDDFSLSYRLVGSSKRNLVIKHHNKGFDLDYQIIIKKTKSNLTNPKEIKKAFFDFIQNNTKSKYKIENSKSAITIKKVKNNQITISFDIVIVKENNNSCQILRRTKDNNFGFEELPEYSDFKNNMKIIKENRLGNSLREQYLWDKKENIRTSRKEKSYLTLIRSAKTIVDNF